MSNFREKMVEKLKNDANIILECKMTNALGNDNEGSYRNLVNSLDSVIRLIERYEWKTKWSKYKDEDGKQFISIWEQNSDGDIKDSKVFALKED